MTGKSASSSFSEKTDALGRIGPPESPQVIGVHRGSSVVMVVWDPSNPTRRGGDRLAISRSIYASLSQQSVGVRQRLHLRNFAESKT